MWAGERAGPRRPAGSLRLLRAPRRLRVEDVAKAVAEEVEREHDREDREARKRPHPPPLEVLRPRRDHRAPLGLRRLRPEPEEREPGEQQDGVREVERGENEY